MQNTRTLALWTTALLLPLAGCVQYIETETPEGIVEEEFPYLPGHDPHTTIRDRGEMQPEDLDLPTDRRFLDSREEYDRVIDEFELAYRNAGRPRLAVYLNRELSANIREWDVLAGVTVTELPEERGDPETRTYAEIHAGPADDGSRPAPAREGWMWAFENSFVAPLLAANATVVDRALVNRLGAAEAADDGEAYGALSAKKVETDALSDHADLLIEVLVSRDPSMQWGYAFRATAKEVRTGAILASVVGGDLVALGVPAALRVPNTEGGYRAGSAGYEAAPPQVEVVAEALASKLMASLAARWG